MAEASGSGEVAVVGVTKRFGETTAVSFVVIIAALSAIALIQRRRAQTGQE